MEEFIEKRIQDITCPCLLEYWEWMFGLYNLEALLDLPPNPFKKEPGESFTWEYCKHHVKDPVFFKELMMWLVAYLKRNNLRDDLREFYVEIRSRPKSKIKAIKRPRKFKRFKHECKTCKDFEWTEFNYWLFQPKIFYIFSTLKFNITLQKEKARFAEEYNQTIHLEWNSIKQSL